MKAKSVTVSVMAAVAVLGLQTARAQSDKAAAINTPDVAKTLKAAADALGMPRWSGLGGAQLPELDTINRVEFQGSGTTYGSGQGTALKTDYHVALSYNPPAMRVEMTRTNPAGGAPQHTIQTVRENYAWNESELGAGLEPGKGTATPAMAAVKERLLQLWILPYGVVKAALAAGDKTKISTENGVTVVSFPLSGQLAGVTIQATLDAKNLITKVDTRTDNPALGNMVTETEYSNYADHGEIPTDVKSPGHIIQKQGGRTVLDIQVKSIDISPYLVFPVPPNVKKEAPQESAASK
jgi:hypothetical protein